MDFGVGYAVLQAVVWGMYFVGHMSLGQAFGAVEMVDYTGNLIALATLIFSAVT